MGDDRMYPMFLCSDLDESIVFCEAFGFARTYRQFRPKPYSVVARGNIQVFRFGVAGFDPANSYDSVSVVVPNPDSLSYSFAAGLRWKHGKLPVADITCNLRPRKTQGTVS